MRVVGERDKELDITLVHVLPETELMLESSAPYPLYHLLNHYYPLTQEEVGLLRVLHFAWTQRGQKN